MLYPDKLVVWFFNALVPKNIDIDYLLGLSNSEIVPFLPRISPKMFKDILELKKAYDHSGTSNSS